MPFPTRQFPLADPLFIRSRLGVNVTSRQVSRHCEIGPEEVHMILFGLVGASQDGASAFSVSFPIVFQNTAALFIKSGSHT